MYNLPVFIALETDVLLDKKLSNTEKIVYSVICALANNDKKVCYASNKYICELIGVNKRQLNYCINKLKVLKYVNIQIFNGNKREITPTINKFLEYRKNKIKNLDLVEYDWLNLNE